MTESVIAELRELREEVNSANGAGMYIAKHEVVKWIDEIIAHYEQAKEHIEF